MATPDAYKKKLDGGTDIVLAQFSGEGARRWSTYYGGSTGESEFGVAALDAGHIYVAGGTGSSDMLASKGAHDEVFDGGEHDGFLARFAVETGQPCAGPGTCPGGYCVDGVCCDKACGDSAEDCQVCAAALGAVGDGTCSNLGAAVTCRAGAGPCDPPEHCSGNSGQCPADALAEDGTACDSGVCDVGICVPTEGTSGTSTSGEPATTGTAPEDSTGGQSTSGQDTGGQDTGGQVTGGQDTGAETLDPGDPGGTSAVPTGGAPGTGSDDVGDTSGGATAGGAVDGAGCGCNDTNPAPWALLVLLLARRRSRGAL